MVRDGNFRQDLYYRINVIDLHIPPLRDRPGDIPCLTDHILTKLTGDSRQDRPILSASALAALQQYPFPGNVRELENILERALALYDGKSIEKEDLNLPTDAHIHAKEPEYDSALGALEDHLEKIERKIIATALEQNQWDKMATALQLRLSYRSLNYRLKKLNMDH
jgi:two-component system response regulator PilR (NtrC family)